MSDEIKLPSVPGPSDRTTLTPVVDAYRETGFGADFWAEPEAMVRCGTCSVVVEASQLAMYSVRRLEGASDPDDMVSVVATSCPHCGAAGTIVLGYGPMSSETDARVFAAMHDRRGADADVPPDAAPGEMNEPGATDGSVRPELSSGGAPAGDE